MKGRHRDRRSRKKHGLELGVRRNGPRAADIHADAEELGVFLLSRELERRRPARKLGGRAESRAEREVVHLDDDAVCVEVEGLPPVRPFPAEGRHRADVLASPPVALDRQAPLAHCVQHVGVCGEPSTADDLIGEGRKSSFRDERGVEVAHRAGCGVSRVHEERFACVFTLAIHAVESRPRQIHFAAHLDATWRGGLTRV